jgi:hypothetical protein
MILKREEDRLLAGVFSRLFGSEEEDFSFFVFLAFCLGFAPVPVFFEVVALLKFNPSKFEYADRFHVL